LPTTPQHRKKAEHHEFLSTELNNPFWDWAVTGIFYAALQYIEAYFANQKPPIHPPTHVIRDSYIHADPKLSKVYVYYRQLEDESRDARYDASVTFTQADVTRTRTYLERIKAVVVPLLP
jgi:hypothetical protein